jgi:hypothetical protein
VIPFRELKPGLTIVISPGLLLALTDLLVFSLISLDSAGGINQFLLAGEKRMAFGTDIDLYFFFKGASGLEAVPACARDLDFLIIGMNFWFQLTSRIAKNKYNLYLYKNR